MMMMGDTPMTRWLSIALALLLVVPATAGDDDCQTLDVYIRSAKIYMGAMQKIPDFKSAQKQLDKAVECYPTATHPRFLLSKIYYQKRLYSQLLDMARSIDTLDAKNEYRDTVWQMRQAAWGELFNKGVDSLKASNDMDVARAEAQDAGDAALYDSLTNVGRRMLESAKGLFLAAMDMDSTRSEPYQNIAVIDTRLQNWDEALGWYRRSMETKPGDPDLLRNMISLNMRLGNYDSARVYVDQLLEIEPDDLEALLNKAGIFAHTDQPDSASTVFEAIIAMDPNNKDVLFNLAVNQVQVAQAYADQITRYGQQANGFAQEFNTASKGGAKQSELDAIRQKQSDAVTNLKEAKSDSEEAWAKSEALFQRFVALDSTDAEAMYFLGLSEFWLEKYELAAQNLLRAVELRPDYCDALNVLVYAYMKSGKGELGTETKARYNAACGQ